MSLPANPRRRSAGLRTADTLATVGIPKGATFHSPTSPSSDAPRSPPSSPTRNFLPPRLLHQSHTSLEDVVDAHRRRAAMIVNDIDKSLADAIDALGIVSVDDSLPVPRSFLSSVDPSARGVGRADRVDGAPRKQSAMHQHASDSGLGSSIASRTETAAARASAITRSAAASPAVAHAHAHAARLGKRAVNRISEHTLHPLLSRESLKDFRPLVLDVPRRIREKEIVCLRDLEKILLHSATETTEAADLYLEFCLRSIRCIQVTVGYVSDREQVRPDDRPYTHGYFLDLKDQIFQYARQLAGLREDGPAKVDALDLDPADEVRLYGGISMNGLPAELIRVKKDGAAFSLATGEPVELDADHIVPPRLKRSLSEQADDEEEILRSMARRKKNASPERPVPMDCPEPGCLKVFARACDLTKHRKTHLRPWKCSVEACKYHKYGWPTEKELDRHWNDKHSSDPTVYRCRFEPCPYKSKRESNCKQHMEKAHGWHYVRQKSTSKAKSAGRTPSVGGVGGGMQSLSPISNTFSIPTPPSEDSHFAAFGSNFEVPAYPSDQEFLRAQGPIPLVMDDMDLDFELAAAGPRQTSHDFLPYGNTFQDGTEFLVVDDLYAAVAHHIPTPDLVYAPKMMEPLHIPAFDASAACMRPSQAFQAPFSPGAESNGMPYTPTSTVPDEGVEDKYAGIRMTGDFSLFPAVGAKAQHEAAALFHDFSPAMPNSTMDFLQQPGQDLFEGFSLDDATINWMASQDHRFADLS